MNKIQETISALTSSIEINSIILERHNWVVACKKRFSSVRCSDDGVLDVIPAPPFPTLFTLETAQDIVDNFKAHNGHGKIEWQMFSKNEWEQLYLNDLV